MAEKIITGHDLRGVVHCRDCEQKMVVQFVWKNPRQNLRLVRYYCQYCNRLAFYLSIGYEGEWIPDEVFNTHSKWIKE